MFIRLVMMAAVITACNAAPPLHAEFELVGKASTSTLGESLNENDAVILMFLSPECPLCKNYASTLREIASAARKHNITIVAAVSGTFYDEPSIVRYLEHFCLDMPVLKDPEFKLSKYYKATTTPEACLINKDGELMYRGAIDNWAISLGQKRQVITDHYLIDAIAAFAEGRPINPKTTKPVGCFIQ